MAQIKLSSVPPLTLPESAFKGKKQRIYRVGIELEGGWPRELDGTTVKHDGSVHIDDAVVRHYNARGQRVSVGEVSSPPIEVSAVEAWMRKYYPPLVNASCGLHIHMSFERAITYSLLMTPKYDSTILAYVIQWAKAEGLAAEHPLWPRLQGSNRFCKLVYDADAQSRQRKAYVYDGEGNRYTFINRCYTEMQTLEHRYLPMMDSVDQAVSAVNRVIAVTNAFLVATATKEKRVVAENKDSVETYQESRVERI